MRKAQKKQAEDFLEVLGEAHGQIRTAIENKNFPAALGLLGDCQEGAVSLGGMIEASEGEGAVTVRILEKYCELVYQIYDSIIRGETVNGGKAHKHLRSFLLKIENSVKNDIKVKMEAVFLPYKASMWDSLESVWKAADEDADCDAYVVPIPYYDKNPDGSFGEMHYEGRQYPKDVPIVSYKDYDFEKRRPDIIFIHNPYDNNNYVTSVHPDFYSDRLKQFTEKLVYIPYFILDEFNPDDKNTVDKIAHFCACSGVLNADKVIVQSEAIRQVYINVLTDAMKTYGYTRDDWEKKILGLGSPKLDKVLSTKKEELEIPKEWLKVITKPDGSRKKIVLYNTSVSALLQYEEKMLARIKESIRIFERNKEETALLWRPHPLMKATIKSMRPNLLAEYERIVEDYKSAGWGIYDESADLDRAIMLSDAYYGDSSSVVELCRKAGLEILLQTINM